MHFARFACTLCVTLAALVACDSSDDSSSDDDDGGGSQNGGNAGTATAGTGGNAGMSGLSGAGTTAGSSGTNGGSGLGGSGNGGNGGSGGGVGGGGGSSGSGGATAGTDSGSGGSAPEGGTAGAGAGSAGTGSADPCASALFCDDFESYTTGQAPGGAWTQRTQSGAVAVDETEHASGTKAVKFTTTGTGSAKTAFLRMQDASVFPVAMNTFYGRMLFYLVAAPSASVHWTFIQGGGLIEGQNYHALYRYGGQQPVGGGSQLMANYETPDSYSGTGPGSDCWHHANGGTVPVGVWSCAEWKFDGSGNEMRFWLDGVAQDDLTVSGTGQGCVNQPNDYPWTAPSFAELELGWESYQTDSDRTLYIDDVVISTTPIGCPG